MNKIIITVSLISLISCSKSDTPTPVDNNTQSNTSLNTYYTPTHYTATNVETNMIGLWSIYKHTHVRHDSTYEIYTAQPNHTIEFNTSNIIYNSNTPEAYTYNMFDIQSSLHHYYVEDMSSDSNWMYLYTYTPSYAIGFDSLFYSLGRIH